MQQLGSDHGAEGPGVPGAATGASAGVCMSVTAGEDQAARAGEQATWPGSKGASGSLRASPGCERAWVPLVVRAPRVSYGTRGVPSGLGAAVSTSVLVSAGIGFFFFLVAGVVLCFGVRMRIMLITH